MYESLECFISVFSKIFFHQTLYKVYRGVLLITPLQYLVILTTDLWAIISAIHRFLLLSCRIGSSLGLLGFHLLWVCFYLHLLYLSIFPYHG